MVAFAVSGRELRAALETGVSRVEVRDGGFPQVSGMRYTFDPSAPGTVRSVQVAVSSPDL